MYDGYGEILPPDVSGFGLSLPGISNLLPTMQEFQTSAIAGGGVALGLIGGLGFERILKNKLPMVPTYTYPVVHGLVGAAVGKFVADYNPPLGVGLASGMFALGLVRALQSWFKIDVAFAGLGDIGEIGELADLLGDEDPGDLLPAELNGLENVLVEDGGGVGQIQVQSSPMSGFDGWPLG